MATKEYIIAPSILSADFSRLGDEVHSVLQAGADWVHFDVMDNHYVPNLTIGPMVCQSLRDYGITAPIDVHLMVEPVDELIKSFSKAGATYISPFIGRLDDIGISGVDLIEEIRAIYDNYDDLNTLILAASIRNISHVTQVAMIGADVATIPPKILKELVKHPLTDIGLKNFLDDWASTGQKIK